ncbi:MAG: hypothetical protein CTY34_01990 [Methylobacter sp.]|nr:MAG: hypothetical protein CTY34_01990 [Methylobacter sp.]
MDNIERAEQISEFYLALSLQRRDVVDVDANGYCLNCGDPIDGGRRWCDNDCRDDWARRERRAD